MMDGGRRIVDDCFCPATGRCGSAAIDGCCGNIEAGNSSLNIIIMSGVQTISFFGFPPAPGDVATTAGNVVAATLVAISSEKITDFFRFFTDDIGTSNDDDDDEAAVLFLADDAVDDESSALSSALSTIRFLRFFDTNGDDADDDGCADLRDGFLCLQQPDASKCISSYTLSSVSFSLRIFLVIKLL